MKKTRTKQGEPPDLATRQPLQELRNALLDLHKTLIDSERAVYETDVGPIDSPHHFFQLVTNDPWFAWLRPVSQLIVAMDEALDAQEPLTNDIVDALMNESVFLLIPAETGGEFGERYMAALQRDPPCGTGPRASGQTGRFKDSESVICPPIFRHMPITSHGLRYNSSVAPSLESETLFILTLIDVLPKPRIWHRACPWSCSSTIIRREPCRCRGLSEKSSEPLWEISSPQ
jgi:hypothetical protein